MRSGLVRSLVLSSALVATATLFAPGAAAQETKDTPWLIRARALGVIPLSPSSDPAGLDVKNQGTAEIDISRFITPNFAVELVLATATHEVTAAGEGETSLGSVSLLPPSLVFQFHPVTEGKARPYIGAGVNYTWFYDRTGELETLDVTSEISPVGQVGVDIALRKGVVFNLDAKYIRLRPQVKSGSTVAYDLKIDPLLLSAGVGFRF